MYPTPGAGLFTLSGDETPGTQDGVVEGLGRGSEAEGLGPGLGGGGAGVSAGCRWVPQVPLQVCHLAPQTLPASRRPGPTARRVHRSRALSGRLAAPLGSAGLDPTVLASAGPVHAGLESGQGTGWRLLSGEEHRPSEGKAWEVSPGVPRRLREQVHRLKGQEPAPLQGATGTRSLEEGRGAAGPREVVGSAGGPHSGDGAPCPSTCRRAPGSRAVILRTGLVGPAWWLPRER